MLLVQEIEPFIPVPQRDDAIPGFKKILMLLFHFGHGTYQTPAGIHSAISMSQASVSRALHEVGPVIIQHLMPQHIRFPRSSIEAERYATSQIFPGVFASVDGTHVEIVTPTNRVEDPSRLYRNRKGTNSLNVMGVVSHDHKYLAVNARYPGSVHDSAVWQLSKARSCLLQNFIAGTPIGFVLADKGYPCEPWVLTPIENATTESARVYNRAHKDLRKEVEMTFGETKNTWRCLLRHRVLHYTPEVASMIVCICMTLHNYRLTYNVNNFDGDDYDSDASENSDLEDDLQPPREDFRPNGHGTAWLNEGRNTRNEFINRYF